ncbi:NYN domain-containing protein [candidate division WWE3 bacterium]|nr:NYN domain-containing protein [candidate division WWE3 bacterium]
MNTTQHKEQRVGVFVDVQNMYYSAKNLYSSKVDFGKVLRESVAGRRLVRAFAYVIRADVGAEREFFEALVQRGFEVREKDLQVFYGGAKKGDWDVGLCMDAVRMIPKLDALVLVSGDGDYTDLLDYARSQGVRTEVIGFSKTASRHLIEEADAFTDMSKTPRKFLIGPPRPAEITIAEKVNGISQENN